MSTEETGQSTAAKRRPGSLENQFDSVTEHETGEWRYVICGLLIFKFFWFVELVLEPAESEAWYVCLF